MSSCTPSTRLLPDPNGRRVPYPDPGAAATTLDLIEEQARDRPDAVALVYDGATLTYGGLDRRANTLAAALMDHGARRDTLLPLLVSDGLELPLAMLAAMKAGVPFIPFDPAWPVERLRALLGDLGTDLAVGSPRTPRTALATARTLVTDHRTLAETAEAPAAGRPARPDLFYGFFTSGTTGLPKCTLNVHHGLLNRFLFMTRRFGTGHVSLQNSRSVFDSSLWQLLWPLTSGGSVVMPRRDGLLDLERTVEQIERHGVTITDFVPSIFTVLVDLLASEPRLRDALRSLRHVLLGGEAINVDAVRRFLDLLPGTAVTNTYGPTEASIGSVFHTLTAVDGEEIPLGRPIDNTSAIVVDDALRRLGTGETGEILIGGDCLGLGYLGAPQRTATAFGPNPFPNIPGDRLYRTGDLGQYRADGRLYFVGRHDDQVKVRGVRIEPAEVERALLALPGVQDVKVVVQGEADRTMLVAAVVAEDSFDAVAARSGARKLLPAEQVPDRFVPVTSMPLSPNGKADRRALARLLAERAPEAAECGTAGRAGDTPEEAVRALWTELLGTGHEADPDDNFFDFGATSLSLQSLALRLRDLSGVRVSVRDLMAAQTIRAQAELVARGGAVRDVTAVRRQMLADAMLPQRSTYTAPTAPTALRHVFLTGGTGFLGIHLLDELLRTTGATVACLVNAPDDAAARARLDARARHYRLPLTSADERIEVIRGDLGTERFGLGEEAFIRLAERTGAIVHAGAEVNLLYPYQRLRPANVLGTREVIRLARGGSGPPRPVHHLSTLALLPHGAAAPDESTFPSVGEVPESGYSQTKWVAEAMLQEASRQYGLPVSLYRMGEVMPHTRTGVFSHGGGLAEFVLDACAKLGVFFETDAVSDFTPVDHVSRFIAAAVRGGCLGTTFHVVQREPIRLDDLLGRFAVEFGLRQVTYPEFHRMVGARDTALMRKLVTILPDPGPGKAHGLHGLFRSVLSPDFSRNCHKLLQSIEVDWSPVGPEVFARYATSRRPAQPVQGDGGTG
ncbi:amino acid adenylation domain-containing protein [Streptomyces caelestis]|uniref:non-ribosomal peptide synthetase n=1 Tax=Streptomyces caelestis TaxID=36816 RepID=UPI0037F63B81